MSECSVVLMARRKAGSREFEVNVDAEYVEHLIDGMAALVEEICSCTGMLPQQVMGLLEDRMP